MPEANASLNIEWLKKKLFKRAFIVDFLFFQSFPLEGAKGTF